MTEPHETPLREAVRTDKAPAAIGPYSQAIRANGFIYVSGQIALDPATGQLVEGPIEVQVRQVLSNLKAILAACGATFEHVVKTTIFLRSMGDFAEVNRVYAEFFPEPAPARSTVAVAELPRGAAVEIEAVAVDPRSASLKNVQKSTVAAT
ncbi:MAG: RidA family protein [Bacillota bacterium]